MPSLHPPLRSRIAGLLLLGLVVSVILAPHLIAPSGLRDSVLQAALPKLNGRITWAAPPWAGSCRSSIARL